MFSVKREDVECIKKFIDYLYVQKSEEMLSGVNKNELETVFAEYIGDNKVSCDNQLYRIDRNSIFGVICYIVNNYCSGMTALQDKHSEWIETGEWNTLVVYHKLSVKSYSKNVYFETEVDRCGCFPEEKRQAIVNYGKQTYINYFELKEVIYPLLSSNSYCVMLMELIEERFKDAKVLTATDVLDIFEDVKKARNEKVKIKKRG